MNSTPPVRLTLDKVVVRVIQLPLRRPIVAKLGEFKNFPFILPTCIQKKAWSDIVILSRTASPRPNPSSHSSRTWRSNSAAVRSLHLLGRQGVMLIAIAALDMAMWDALAKALGLPLVVALGGTVGPVRAYNTNGLWLIPIDRIADEASALIAEGDFKALKIRLGRDASRTT
jgi:mandelate racemase